MRINQFIARHTGVSRRSADKLIQEGKVHLNSVPVQLGQQVDANEKGLTIQGEPIRLSEEKKIVIAINKPKGYICTRNDPEGRKTVMELVPGKYKNLKPVGRLDIDSEGLLLLTNDGTMHYESTHPKFNRESEYLVRCTEPIHDTCIKKLLGGIRLEEGIARVDKARRVNAHTINIVLRQGWKRQVKRMLESCGNTVERIIRLRADTVELGKLKSGLWKKVTL